MGKRKAQKDNAFYGIVDKHSHAALFADGCIPNKFAHLFDHWYAHPAADGASEANDQEYQTQNKVNFIAIWEASTGCIQKVDREVKAHKNWKQERWKAQDQQK